MTNVFLTYYKTVEKNGQDWYYMRGVFLPTNMTADILLYVLRLLGEDLTDFFDIEIATPDFIAQGTSIWSITGSPWVAPCDLYKQYVKDYPFIAAGVGLSNLPARIPWAIYNENPPSVQQRVNIPDEDKPLLPAETASNIVKPTSEDLKSITVGSGHSDYPLSTYIRPSMLWVYEGCDYSSTPYHATQNLSVFNSITYDQHGAFLQHDGHAYTVNSCNTSQNRATLEYQAGLGGDGDWYLLQASAFVATTPAYVFSPDFFTYPDSRPLIAPPGEATPITVGTPSKHANRFNSGLNRRYPKCSFSAGPAYWWRLRENTFSQGLFAAELGEIEAIASTASPSFGSDGYAILDETWFIDFPVTTPVNFRFTCQIDFNADQPDAERDYDSIVAFPCLAMPYDPWIAVIKGDDLFSRHPYVTENEVTFLDGRVYPGLPDDNVHGTGIFLGEGEAKLSLTVINNVLSCGDLRIPLYQPLDGNGFTIGRQVRPNVGLPRWFDGVIKEVKIYAL